MVDHSYIYDSVATKMRSGREARFVANVSEPLNMLQDLLLPKLLERLFSAPFFFLFQASLLLRRLVAWRRDRSVELSNGDE